MAPLILVMLLAADDTEKFGRVVTMSGRVLAQASAGARQLGVGDSVFRGERISTDAEGRVKMLLEDRSVVTLGPQSELELVGVRQESRPKTSVKLLLGRLWANVQKALAGEAKFDVEAPNAVAGVRGTSFFAEVEGKNSRFAVWRGSVDVDSKSGQHASLKELEQLIATEIGLSSVSAFEKDALDRLLNAIATSGQLGEAGKLQRLEQLERSLSAATVQQTLESGPRGTQGNTIPPPVNIDPQQTAPSTIIHGKIQIAP